MKRVDIIKLVLSVFFLTAITSHAQRKMEDLDRGLVAVKKGTGIYLNWRIPGTELRNVAYNIYRDGTKINDDPITGSSNYTDNSGTVDNRYTVRAIENGIEQTASDEAAVWSSQYIDIPVQAINGTWSTYNINDASVGDLDGDGEYEIVVKRLPNNGEPESTDYNMLEAYKLDGSFMWRINLGPNINNAVETNFLVYDFDEDGKAEIITRTSDGMIDGVGTNIGDRDNDGKINYRNSFYKNSDYYRTEGPDYISVFDGETGEELAWDVYIERDPIVQWGSPGMNLAQLGHRATKCMWTVAYLDGKHPSFVNSRGIYHRTKLEAWDWDGTSLSKRWAFDSGTSGEYYGQGNHQLSCADVDNDGCDEVVYGSMTVDNDGTGLYSANTGHGDALHVSDMDPDRPGLEIWNCLEGSNDWGATLKDASNGHILIRYRSNRDCGRCAAGDISDENKGFELWAATECPMYDVDGNIVGTNNVPQNFMIWWDGDLSREFHTDANFSSSVGYGVPDISKYNPDIKDNYTIFRANGTATNNWTKGTPCLQADIIGDWREELLVRTTDNKNLRLYTTNIETEERVPTLMHEPQYRIAISWQNNSYNQPPHTGIYLGNETLDVPPYPMSNGYTIWHQGANWDKSASNWKDEDGTTQQFNDGARVLFDYTGDNAGPVNISETLSPKELRVQSYTDYEFSGAGKLSGNMDLLKAGTGTLAISNDNDFSGETMVYSGTLKVNGDLSGSHATVAMFGSLYMDGTIGNGLEVKPDGKFSPGTDKDIPGITTVYNGMVIHEDAKLYFDLSDEPTGGAKANDVVSLSGDLTINGPCNFIFNRQDDTLSVGIYDLIVFDGTLTGNVDDIRVLNIPDVAYQVLLENGKLSLEVLAIRESTDLVWSGDLNNIWDYAGEKNWSNDGESDWFLGNDNVTFNEQGAAQSTINITEDVPVGALFIEGTSDFRFIGQGMISGSGGLTKNGNGKLFIDNINAYKGATILNGGLIEISHVADAGELSPVGAASSDASNFVINGAILRVSGKPSSTNRSLTLGNNSATLYVDYSLDLEISGSLTGSGALIKDGNGDLTLLGANTYSGGTIVNAGSLSLGNETANIDGIGSGKVTLKNATLSMYDNAGSSSEIYWDLDVPSGFNATLNMDARCAMYGNLTGAGTLNVFVPYVRSDLLGDWSAFEGKVNVTTDTNGGWLLLGNQSGYKNTSFNLSDKIKALYRHSEDVTIEIGEITGTASSILGSGGEGSNLITWKVGGKNTNFTFDGQIKNDQYSNSGSQAAIIKTGSGKWTLTNSNSYSGGTLIEKGSLLAENTFGSATGTGPVIINAGGLLGGAGSVGGPVTVNGNGYISPGNTSGIGSLTVNGDLNIENGAYLIAKVDADNDVSDIVDVKGQVNLDGAKLYLNKINGTYSLGDHFKVLNATNINGTVSGAIPSTPGEGLYWDFSSIHTGWVKVSNQTAINDHLLKKPEIYPNPSKGRVSVDLSSFNAGGFLIVETISGKQIYSDHISGGTLNTFDLSHLEHGIYLVKIKLGQKEFEEKLIVE